MVGNPLRHLFYAHTRIRFCTLLQINLRSTFSLPKYLPGWFPIRFQAALSRTSASKNISSVGSSKSLRSGDLGKNHLDAAGNMYGCVPGSLSAKAVPVAGMDAALWTPGLLRYIPGWPLATVSQVEKKTPNVTCEKGKKAWIVSSLSFVASVWRKFSGLYASAQTGTVFDELWWSCSVRHRIKRWRFSAKRLGDWIRCAGKFHCNLSWLRDASRNAK